MHTNSNFKLYTEIIRYAKYVRRYVAANIPAVHSLSEVCDNLWIKTFTTTKK